MANSPNKFDVDPLVEHQLDLIANALMMRSNTLSRLLDTRRDIDKECHYPLTGELTPEYYYELFERNGIATRVNDLYPSESWAVTPGVYESEDESVNTDFELAWDEIGKSLSGTEGLFNGEEGNPIWDILYRVDLLSGIGHYGVLLLGLDDGQDLSEPVKPKKGKKLLYLRPFSQNLVSIGRYTTDVSDPRYGQPETYNLSFLRAEDYVGETAIDVSQHNVHWTRIIHIADNCLSSNIFGVPRTRPVLNRCLDLRKLYGGSAEMYWKGAYPGISLETHPQLGGDVKIDVTAIKGQMQDYMDGLQRYLTTSGMTANTLSPQVADPTGHIKNHLEEICIYLKCPMRIFLGSERGELASSQDSDTWDRRVAARQARHVTTNIISPFVMRLIILGVLPRPKEFGVDWPDLVKASKEKQAAIATSRMTAFSTFIQGGVESLMEPLDFLVGEMGHTTEEAEAILKAKQKALQDAETGESPKKLLELVGGVTGMTELFKQFHEGIINKETLAGLMQLFYGVTAERAAEIIGDTEPASPEELAAKQGKQPPTVGPDGKPIKPPVGTPKPPVAGKVPQTAPNKPNALQGQLGKPQAPYKVGKKNKG